LKKSWSALALPPKTHNFIMEDEKMPKATITKPTLWGAVSARMTQEEREDWEEHTELFAIAYDIVEQALEECCADCFGRGAVHGIFDMLGVGRLSDDALDRIFASEVQAELEAQFPGVLAKLGR
jgi:hypothetical protein